MKYYRCEKCNSEFSTPEALLWCPKCGQSFDKPIKEERESHHKSQKSQIATTVQSLDSSNKPKKNNWSPGKKGLITFLALNVILVIVYILWINPIINNLSLMNNPDLGILTEQPSLYYGKSVTIQGQIKFLPNYGYYILDSTNNRIPLKGDFEKLDEGFYSISGTFNSDNSLTFEKIERQIDVIPVNEIPWTDYKSFLPVVAQGLVTSPPKYIEVGVWFPYIIYNREGIYLILCSEPSENLYFSDAIVTGTLISPEKLNIKSEFLPGEIKGIIIANDITRLDPIPVTVQEINQNSEKYAFKRVTIEGYSITSTSKIGYKKENSQVETRISLGYGIAGDEWSLDKTKWIVTLEPELIYWQIRQGTITGTVIYPTEEINRYFTQKGMDGGKYLKPFVIVEPVKNEEVNVKIKDLIYDLQFNNGQTYEDKVVVIEGYALGYTVPCKELSAMIGGIYNPALM